MRRSAATGTHRATPTRKLIRKSTSAKDIRHLSEKVTLERVLGLTTSNTNGLTCNPYSGIIAYPAGCVIVLFNPRKNSQAHILNPEKKTLTALAFSKDGKYLASGESGHNPRVRVWELGDTVTQVAELNGHKFSINCVAFSPNLKYLVSIGDQHDMLVNIWNWRTGDKVACNKIGCKVRSVSFAENGAYFVTVGNRHVKFWYFDTEVGSKSNVPTPIAGRSGILGELRNNCFCDVKCGIGDNATNTYAVTKSGLLCSFNEKRILDRWVELRSTGANSLSVNEKYVFCGCADGIIRVFHPTTMHFISTLPKPHFLGVDVAAGLDASHMIAKDTNVRYPDVVSLALDDDNDKLCCVYNDHSLYVWDVHDVKKVGKACSFLYHSACIWGIETYPLMSESENPCLPSGSFLTCSSDDTVRVWNIDDGATLNNTFPNNIYSKELLKIIYTDEDLTNIQDISSIPVSTSSDIKTGIRCLQVSPDGQLLAAGDRSGNLRVYDLQFVDEIMKIEAHEAEILCVEFSDPKSGYRLLTTSSRDRLIHIFDIDKDFTLVQTIDDHASSVTAVRLNYDDGVFQLLSCGADKHIMIHTSQQVEDGRGINFVRENTIAIGKATLYDMDIDPTRKYATTCGQDRNVRIYDIQGVKQTHCYKGSVSDDGTLIKIQLDPSGVYAATSCSDKSVNIYDFEAGECSAVMYGHSELVTGLKFTRDGTRLISVSGDNCIFVWRLTPTLTQAIIMRLQELGKPLPRDLNIKDNALSALRNTFVIPKIGKDDLQDVIEEEEFSELDPTMFEKDANDDLEGQFDYRFSVGQLPAWAQKQITGEKESAEGITGFGVPHASGRWAQRVNEVPVVLTAQERTLSNGTMSSSNITADVTSSIIAESTVTGERTTITDDSVFQKGVPYASHQKSKNHKDENVIYIPSSQEEFDAEITSFQVTARASTKSRKISDEVSTRTFSEDGNHFPQKQDGEQKESVESDSLQDDDADDDDLEEEEEELSENENLDAEHAIEEEDENSIQSPLEQHFEYLAGDLVDENKEENEYQVNESPGFETKHKKGQSFLSRCRSSISAKFLSKSQKAGKNSQLTDEQRKRLDSLKRVIDQNQNYGTSPTTRQLNTKEVRRMKRLSAKSEPNLSFGMPPPAGKTARKSASGNRRGPGVAESQLDLRSIKENRVIEDDLQSRDRVRQLRGSSTSSISPTDREKTTSDLISLFNQRSSTPKPKTDVRSASPVNMARNTRTGQRNSPVVSPVSSPTKHRPPMGVWKDDKVGGSLLKPREEHEQKSSSKDLAVKRRPRKSGERPQLRNRPRSLIIPTQTSLDDLISAHLNQAHSDTELDDESKGEQISKRRKFVREEKPARRFLPVSPLNPALETLVESGNSSLIVRDINIDDSLKSTSRKSWVENTVIFAEHKPDDHDVKSEPIPTVKDLGAPVVSKESFCDEKAQPNVVNDTKETVTGLYGASESSGRLSPPVRDTPMQQQGNEIEVERPPVERHEDEISLMSSHSQSEEEDSIAQCQTAIDGLMSSFKEVSSCHEKALANMNAENRAKILGMLSETYKAIIETTSHKKEEIEKDTKFCGNQEVDSHLQQLLAAMKINGERKEKEQTKQVVDILDHYSDALVKLVEVKLNNKH